MPWLTLPDGEILLPQQNYTGAPWGGYYTFPPLPEGVMALNFEVSRLPGIPAGKAAEGWHFDLDLGYAAEQPAAPDAPDFTPSSVLEVIPLPEPTSVEESSEETLEIKIEVVEVIYAETETTVRVQMEGIPEEWQLVYQPTLIGILTDDLGNEYLGTFAPGMGLQDDGTYLMFFEPVVEGAQTLTLEIPDITTQVRLENQFVEVDFGGLLPTNRGYHPGGKQRGRIREHSGYPPSQPGIYRAVHPGFDPDHQLQLLGRDHPARFDYRVWDHLWRSGRDDALR